MGYYRNFKSLIKYADINYVYRKKNIADYLQKGAKDIRILLPYYIAENNYKEDCKKDIPVAFLGHYEFDGRDRFIKALVDADIPVTVFNGSYWDKSPLYSELKQYIKPGKSGNEYNHTINRCMIALVFFSKRNSDTYTRRCFEIPATCTLMLSQFSEDMNQMYPEDECAVYFRNEVELVEKCNWLLSHPEEIKRIALNGYNRLKELGGSAIDRCKQIIDCYSEIKKRKEISNGE
jgi:spore maturation protein CgeB